AFPDTPGPGKLTGSGGLTKIGSGMLTLGGGGVNDYTGQTQVLGGVLDVNKSSALGAGGALGNGTTVSAGASLWLDFGSFGTIATEQLSLNGDGVNIGGVQTGALRNSNGANQWGGNVTLASASSIRVDVTLVPPVPLPPGVPPPPPPPPGG